MAALRGEVGGRLAFRWLLFLLLGAALGLESLGAPAPGKPWETKPASAWSQAEALALLDKSPWTAKVEIQQATGRQLARFSDGRRAVYREGPDRGARIFSQEPEGIEPEYVRAVYAVRWSSAEVVQQGLARLGELAPALQEMQAVPPGLLPANYVLTVRVVEPPHETPLQKLERERTLVANEAGHPESDPAPQVADLFAGFVEEELRARAELVTSTKQRLKPERAVRHGVGTSEGISFFFPRTADGRPTLPPGTVWAEFVFEGRRRDKVKARFNLREMMYQGKADY